MCDVDILTLEDRPQGCLKVSGSNYLVAQCHIPKGWIPLMILAVSSLVLYLTETDHFSIAGIVNAEKTFLLLPDLELLLTGRNY